MSSINAAASIIEANGIAQNVAGRVLAEGLPDADLVVIEDAGHMVSLEKPEAFDRALLDFLKRAWPASASARRETARQRA